jgi:hypothetical protein
MILVVAIMVVVVAMALAIPREDPKLARGKTLENSRPYVYYYSFIRVIISTTSFIFHITQNQAFQTASRLDLSVPHRRTTAVEGEEGRVLKHTSWEVDWPTTNKLWKDC